jgi:hypothetical protein
MVDSIIARIGRSYAVTVNARILQETYSAQFLKSASKDLLAVSCRKGKSKVRRLSPEQRELVIELVQAGAPVRQWRRSSDFTGEAFTDFSGSGTEVA